MKIDPKDIKPGMCVVARTKDYSGGKVVAVEGSVVRLSGGGEYCASQYTFERVKPEVKAGQVWLDQYGEQIYIVKDWTHHGRLGFCYTDGSGEGFGSNNASLEYDELIELVYDPKGN